MTYPEALTYLDSFINYEKKTDYDYKDSFRLDRMRRLALLLGDPQKDMRSVHVAGTKGKGSTAAFIHSILKAAGYKVGLYTSPHLVSFRERIRINDALISEGAVSALLEKVKPAVEKLGEDRPTFFEVYTALAFLYFRENNADIAVYETGLGGRLDATNLVEPLVTVITPISYEHTDKLGNTLGGIASEKAGIIKRGTPCVSAPQEEEALEAISRSCADKGANLILVGRDVISRETRSDMEKEFFSVTGRSGNYEGLETTLLGSHQVVNAATAIAAVEVLELNGIRIGGGAIRSGVSSARWEGRFEIVRKEPYVVLDGAQNRASAKALADTVRRVFPRGRLTLVLGVSRDKDIKGILEEIMPLADSVILTKSNIAERAAEPESIKELMGTVDVTLTKNVKEALGEAFSAAGERDVILVTGSLFVVGEARSELTVHSS